MNTLKKISSKKSSTKWLVIAVVVLASVSASGVAAYHFLKPNDANNTSSPDIRTDNKIDYGSPSDEEKQAGDQQKSDTVNNTPNENSGTENSLEVTLTSLNQNGNTVQIRSMVSSVIQGSCTLTVTNGNVNKTYYADIQPQANTSSCMGFDIPVSDIQTGNWSIKLSVTSNNSQQGEASTTLEVK